MTVSPRWTASSSVRPRGRRDFWSGMAGLVGGLTMVVALAMGAALAVIFAATLAVVTALATVLLALSALAWSVRPQPQRAVLRSRNGHAWVAYRLDSSGR